MGARDHRLRKAINARHPRDTVLVLHAPFRDVNDCAAITHMQLLPPLPASSEVPAAGAWRDGNLLVAANEAVLPDRCIVCNVRTTEPPYQINLFWKDGRSRFFPQRWGAITIWLCPRHYLHQKVSVMGAWAGAILTLVLICLAFGLHRGAHLTLLLILGGAALLVTLGFPFSLFRRLRTVKFDQRHVWLDGAATEFLNALPPFPTSDD